MKLIRGNNLSILLFICLLMLLGTGGQAFAAFFDPHGHYDVSTKGCGICHYTHASKDGLLLAGEQQKLVCYSCHNGTGSKFNVLQQFGETVVGTSVYKSVYPSYHGMPNSAAICTTCHNPHLAGSGTPRLLAVNEGVYSSGNDVCGNCHGPGSAAPGGDILNPYKGTAHDLKVTDPATGTKIKCARCHQPHGSSYKPLLNYTIVSQTGTPYQVTGNNNTVCFGCHRNASNSYAGSTVFQATYHGQKTSSVVASVYFPGTKYQATLCLNCHEPHGKTGISFYRRASGNNLCTTCHDAAGTTKPASYSYQGVTAYVYSAHGSTDPMPSSFNYDLGGAAAMAWESSGLINQAPTPTNPGALASTAKKADAASINGAFWATGLATAEGVYNYQLYRFHLNQTPGDVRQLSGTWIGYGEPTVNHPTSLLVWNKNSSSWEVLSSQQLGDPNNPGKFTWTISSGPDKYVDVNSNVYLLARAMHDHTGPQFSGISASTGPTSATVNFTTDEWATATVYYGLTPAACTTPVNELAPGVNHTAIISPVPGLLPNTIYYYKIGATDKLGNYRETAPATLHTNTPPNVPTNLVGPTTEPWLLGNPLIGVSWTAPADPDAGDTISGYEVQVLVNGNYYTTATSATNSANFYLTYEGGPCTVTWQVRAKDNHGQWSNWSSVSAGFPHQGPDPPSSCPNLYVWNGTKVSFVTDLTGGALGKKIGTGKYQGIIPWLPVVIPENLLKEKDGQYEIRLKSERDEVDFVDWTQLVAVDHPIGTGVALNELVRGKLPTKLYTYNKKLQPLKKATYYNPMNFSGGEPIQSDITDLVARIDDHEARGTNGDDNQFTLDLGDMSNAKAIKLVLKGWTEYRNPLEVKEMDKKRKEGKKTSSTYYEVLQPDGSWKKNGLMHFNGLDKTTLLDLTGKFPKNSSQYIVRLHGMLRPRIDFIGIDTTPDVPYTSHNLELLDAKLAFKGPAMQTSSRDGFDYYQLADNAIFHEGKFTRYGDVMPLLKAVDDKLVIMDNGDELTLHFPVLPPPAAGMTRSFLFKPYVYYKETDMARVDPIPFRGLDMEKLPKSLGEYPKELKASNEVWNTRVHNAGVYPVKNIDIGFWERLSRWFTDFWAWLGNAWEAVTKALAQAIPDSTGIVNTSVAAGEKAPKKARHFSLNTEYLELQVRAVDPIAPKGYCGACHTPHGINDGNGNPIIKQLELAPDRVCFGGDVGCHTESTNSHKGISIAQRFTASTNITSHHSISPAEQAAGGTKLQCTNCHNPHIANRGSKVIDP
ncbi:MAG TPA: cytochrome c3 family protein, partial [Bacillota bacterium]|nr:cytochrome c3 family protein [Bacillota bacterium]